MKQIVCSIEIGDRLQTVHIIDENQNYNYQIALSSLSDLLLNYAYEYNIFDIHLYGPGNIVLKTITDVENAEKNNYGINKIRFEVN